MDLLQLLFGSLLLSSVHALIPNHWIPLLAVGKAEHWTRSETLMVTAIVGLAHASSTILIGILVGLAGFQLSARYETAISIVAPALLLALGVGYLVWDRVARQHSHQHFEAVDREARTSKFSLVAPLGIAMFFSPCIELEAYFFSAGSLGWPGIILVSLVYLLVTVAGMMLLVDLGLRGARRIRSHVLEHHEKRVTGLLLVVLGVVGFFVQS